MKNKPNFFFWQQGFPKLGGGTVGNFSHIIPFFSPIAFLSHKWSKQGGKRSQKSNCKKEIFVVKIWKYALCESSGGLFCVCQKPANSCHHKWSKTKVKITLQKSQNTKRGRLNTFSQLDQKIHPFYWFLSFVLFHLFFMTKTSPGCLRLLFSNRSCQIPWARYNEDSMFYFKLRIIPLYELPQWHNRTPSWVWHWL